MKTPAELETLVQMLDSKSHNAMKLHIYWDSQWLVSNLQDDKHNGHDSAQKFRILIWRYRWGGEKAEQTNAAALLSSTGDEARAQSY